jgi:hypothetical protein
MSTKEDQANENPPSKAPNNDKHDDWEADDEMPQGSGDSEPKTGQLDEDKEKARKTVGMPKADEDDEGLQVIRPGMPKENPPKEDKVPAKGQGSESGGKKSTAKSEVKETAPQEEKKSKKEDQHKANNDNQVKNRKKEEVREEVPEKHKDVYLIPKFLEFVSIAQEYYQITLPQFVGREEQRGTGNQSAIKLFKEMEDKLRKEAKLGNRIVDEQLSLEQFKQINEELKQMQLSQKKGDSDKISKLESKLKEKETELQKYREQINSSEDELRAWRTFKGDFEKWAVKLPESMKSGKDWAENYTVEKVKAT